MDVKDVFLHDLGKDGEDSDELQLGYPDVAKGGSGGPLIILSHLLIDVVRQPLQSATSPH
jgi:hypothetical protein